MNELAVQVQQTPGTIAWNFDELKSALEYEMKTYEGMIYTDDSIPSAKKDLAMLRKLKNSVEDRRKEIKKKCLEPYAVIEKQAKELTGLIDKPVNLIDEQVKTYETEQKQKKKAAILEFMAKEFGGLDGTVAKRLQFKIYDSRWENVSTSEKTWKEAIQQARKQTEDDLKILADVDEDFREASIEAYKQNLVLNEALQKAAELRRQKEIVLENERRRQEALRRQQEEQARKDAEEAAQDAQNAPESVSAQQVGISAPKQEETPQPVVTEPTQHNEPAGGLTCIFRVTGDESLIKKVYGYIKFLGLECEVRKDGD